eukprot:493054_1
MCQAVHKDSRLSEKLTSLTKELGSFDTNYGLANDNYTTLVPFILENPVKMNELKAVKQSLPSWPLDLQLAILEYSHQYYTTSDFMHSIISYYNNNSNLIPSNMREYHESVETKQQLQNIDQLKKEYLPWFDDQQKNLEFLLGYNNRKILTMINHEIFRREDERIKIELEQILPTINVEDECNDLNYSFYKKYMKWTDFQILKQIRYPNHRQQKFGMQKPENVNILLEYIEKMEQCKYELHFPLKFQNFASRQIMHRMIVDHEKIIREHPEIKKYDKDNEYDEFVDNVNMLKQIVEFVQNNTSNSRIYSIPTFCGDGQYWSDFGDKYYGTVFVLGETQNGNLLGFHFEQGVSI